MVRRFLMMVCLALAGSLAIVGCEPPADNKTSPPKLPDSTKPPEKAPTPPPATTPPAPDKK